MNPTIDILKGSDGSLRMTALIGEGSKRYFTLMDHDYVTLKFSTESPAILHLGDYITLENGGRYEIIDPAKGDFDVNTGGYAYEVRLDAQYWKFKNKLFKFLPQTGSNETSWTYTDTIANHAEQVMANLNALAGRGNYRYNGEKDWEYAIDESVDAVKAVTISYDKMNIIDAIAEIAEQFDCEWWFEENVLHFGKCQFGEPVRLEMGKEVVAISRSSSSETYATRIYAYGSDRNLASTYRKDLVFDATTTNGQLLDTQRPVEIGYFTEGKVDKIADISNGNVTAISEKATGKDYAPEYGSATQLYKAAILANDYNTLVSGPLSYEGTKYVLSASNLDIRFTQHSGEIGAKVTAIVQYRFILADSGIETAEITAETTVEALGKEYVLSLKDFAKTLDGIPKYVYLSVRLEYSNAKGGTFNASAQIEGKTAVCYYPSWMATGVEVEVLDGSGEVARTICGATFNADFSSCGITLPDGESIPNGTKYKLPQLNKAVVPASYFTSIYAILDKYNDVTTNGIVNSRLLLPQTDEDGNPLSGYIDAFDFEADEEAVEDVVIFEDVYPSRTSKITELWRSDEYVDEQEEQDGSTTQTKWRAYRYRDDLFNEANPFDVDNYMLDDAQLQITFQSGMLNGMTFDVAHDSDECYFEIQRDDTTKMPNEIIKPVLGDEFILSGFNIAMLSDEKTDYVANAEKELLEKAREYVAKLNTDAETYECTIGCDVAYEAQKDTESALYLTIGQAVNLIHPSYFANGRVSRVIGYEVQMDIVYDNPVYIIGEKASYSRIGEIEDKVDSLGDLTGSLGAMMSTTKNTSGASSVYVIGRQDTTAPSDKNVYSALRSRAEFILKSAAQTIEYLWTFAKGIRVGTYLPGVSGAQVDSAGNAEVESLTSRSYLKVQELIYNRINALEGDTMFADSGTIEDIQDNGDGTILAQMRRRWDGDFTTFKVGDIVFGYVNNLDNAGAKEYFKAWAWVKSVDAASNTITLATYDDAATPAGVNHPMQSSMMIARWGNIIEPSLQTYENPEYEGIITATDDGYSNTRQRSFYISCDEGALIELTGVNSPILKASNYGTVLGRIPDNLLDSATAELINKGQPYLYARGVIVQDLIRIGYEGVKTRDANYRGIWSAATAAHSTLYYRSEASMYDTVTHNGAMWQCLVSKTLAEPSETSGAWLKMTAELDDAPEVKMWALNPSASIVSVRSGVVVPSTLTCTVVVNSSLKPTREITNNYDLLDEGAKLFYSVDEGETFFEFIIGTAEPIDLEDESGVIELEQAQGDETMLTLGGDDIATNLIGDRIIFELRDADTNETMARTHVPVVRDGADGNDGIDGRDGLMAYPAGSYDNAVTYSATDQSTPIVLYNEQYYALRRGASYRGSEQPSTRNTPALDVANAPAGESYWVLFDKFNAVFADIVMADFAKLGSAVFYGDWMISQQGTANGVESTKYEGFKDGSFEPYFSVNFRTGEMRAASGVFSGSLLTKMKTLADSDATTTDSSTYTLNSDLNIVSSAADTVVLPTDASYIGRRAAICNNVTYYSRTDHSTKITTAGGDLILGYPGNIGEVPSSGSYSVTLFSLLTGVAELIALPITGDSLKCQWCITNLNAYYHTA